MQPNFGAVRLKERHDKVRPNDRLSRYFVEASLARITSPSVAVEEVLTVCL